MPGNCQHFQGGTNKLLAEQARQAVWTCSSTGFVAIIFMLLFVFIISIIGPYPRYASTSQKSVCSQLISSKFEMVNIYIPKMVCEPNYILHRKYLSGALDLTTEKVLDQLRWRRGIWITEAGVKSCLKNFLHTTFLMKSSSYSKGVVGHAG